MEPASNGAVAAQVPSGKVLCIITNKLRPDTPEEHVRQRVARNLLDGYGYSRSDIEVEFPLKVGSKTGRRKPRLDLAIFKPGVPHDQAGVFVAIECKREDVKDNDIKEGTEQLLYYMAASPNCRFGLWVGSKTLFFEKVKNEKTGAFEFPEASDIPKKGFDTPRPMKHADLVPASEEDLVAAFRRCHNYIYANQGLEKEQAFREFLKLIFSKVYDEDRVSGPVRFYIGNEDRRSEIGQRRLVEVVGGLFDEVKRKYKYIFAEHEQVELKPSVLAYVVSELQRYSLTDSPADAKGKAYEELVGTNLLGNRGEYFTPRNVCDMATRMVFATYPESKWTQLKVLDPACGSGGFLVSVVTLLRDTIRASLRERYPGDVTQVESETARILKEVATQNLYGIDFVQVLARAAQMNMVMHGDGSTNIYHADSLLPAGEWPREHHNNPYDAVKLGEFDIVVTNPPFSAKSPVDDPHVLAQYEIATEAMAKGSRKSLPPERLFVERCLKFVKPGGRLAIVVPDSILSNPGLVYLRTWILRNTRVLASVSLPALTFAPQTSTKTSVLILQRKSDEEVRAESEGGSPPDYPVFMATPRAVGHDRRGEPVYLRTPEGDTIEYARQRRIIRRIPGGKFEETVRSELTVLKHDELPEVARYFGEWLEGGARTVEKDD